MAELTIKDRETIREMPGNPEEKGGPAKILRFSLEGDERQIEMFAVASTKVPNIGDKVDPTDLVFNRDWKRWEFKKKGSQKSGGYSGGGEFMKLKHPTEARQIHRQHSQEMALRHEATVVAAGNPPFTLEQVHQLTDWFEADILGKQPKTVLFDPMKSDVPADTTDLP